jgi:transposase
VARLKPYQAATVVRLITDRCPDQLKMPFVLWTREAVRDLIARRFGVRLSVWTVGRYLRHWGFTPQKWAFWVRLWVFGFLNQ